MATGWRDAGPHPNPAKAADGKRLHRLGLDPVTAPVVRRIFDEYLVKELGFYAIAEALTAEGVLSPSAYDRARNRHRPGQAWDKTAVRTILMNPRYTGRQVWNRQRRVEMLVDVEDVTLGHETKMKWNGEDKWVWSNEVVHDPIVSIEEWEATQARIASKPVKPMHERKARVTPRPYALRKIIHCGICSRRMQGTWNNGRPHYRCQYPAEYAVTNDRHPKTVYVREDVVLKTVHPWLEKMFDADHLDDTLAALVAAIEDGADDDEEAARRQAARAAVAQCDARLESYKRALEEGGVPTVIGQWIREASAERAVAMRAAAIARPGRSSLSASDEAAALVGDARAAASALSAADAAERNRLYEHLGVRMTFDPTTRCVRVTGEIACTYGSCRRDDTTVTYMDATLPLATA
jgi:hypothetical protein